MLRSKRVIEKVTEAVDRRVHVILVSAKPFAHHFVFALQQEKTYSINGNVHREHWHADIEHNTE